MSALGDANKTVEEGIKRWEEIEQHAAMLEDALHKGNTDIASIVKRIDAVAELLLLLVKHMQPMNPSQDQIDDIMKDIGNMLSSLNK